ncbi:MAG TPA: ABC transporter ATP-binding protein, partial [Nitrospirota bacterium]|nr:ABC transporter ATP-binding protein [Nitrospirota bacterium]
MYQRILKYVKPYWIRIVIASLCAIGVSGTTAAAAWLVQPALDKIFIQKNVQLLLMIPVVILIIYFIKGICNYYQSYLMRYVGNRVIMDMRNDLYSHIAVMPIKFYTEYSTGKLMSRLLNDVGIINNAASTSIKDLVQNTITVIALFGVIFYQDWRLAAVSCIVLPFAYYPLIQLGRKLRRISRKGQEEISEVTAILHETFTGASVVKAFGMEESEINKFRAKNYSLFKISMKGVKVTELSTPIMEFIGAAGASLIIWYGGYQVVKGVTTPGTFFSFLTALIMMFSPLKALTRVNSAIQQAIAAAERVFAILDLNNERDTDKGTRILNGIKEKIEFKNVSLKYEGSSKHALSNVSLSVRHGKTVAIVGSSGGGKTTIGNLLLRFYEPDAGGIYIDGTDIREFSLSSLR